MKFVQITIVQGSGPDRVMIETDLPSPCPNVDSHELCLNFDAEAGKGPEYVARHFPDVPFRLVERPGRDYRFAK